MNLLEIGQLIQKRRDSLLIKQEDLAELSGITTKTIYMLEKGKGNPSFSTLVKILQVLGLEMTIQLQKKIE
ncbi:MAG: helix-turn-helix domain-containing protein [Bacteroidota bacterium]